mmetsp:Transcript_1008/g.111  ORF Transcript_1008/g.111 Transcript_1008/m.111 type:complete len:96 (-) Transcript_1008:581-868(-)
MLVYNLFSLNNFFLLLNFTSNSKSIFKILLFIVQVFKRIIMFEFSNQTSILFRIFNSLCFSLKLRGVNSSIPTITMLFVISRLKEFFPSIVNISF